MKHGIEPHETREIIWTKWKPYPPKNKQVKAMDNIDEQIKALRAFGLYAYNVKRADFIKDCMHDKLSEKVGISDLMYDPWIEEKFDMLRNRVPDFLASFPNERLKDLLIAAFNQYGEDYRVTETTTIDGLIETILEMNRD